MTEINIQTYLSEMEGRLTKQLTTIDEKVSKQADHLDDLNDEVDGLNVRVSVVETKSASLSKGLWTVFGTLVSAGVTFIISLLKN